jgi:hypothetical protein
MFCTPELIVFMMYYIRLISAVAQQIDKSGSLVASLDSECKGREYLNLYPNPDAISDLAGRMFSASKT